MLNYNHLYYFHVAAMEGSVGAAAGKLGVTQPTVSEQLRALERSLGVTLFDRHPTGLRLSDAGRVAFEHTSVMFGVGERLVKDLDRSDQPQVKTLRVGISGMVSRATSGRFLVPLLSLDCVPVIRLVDCIELMRGLRGGQLDLVLCENPPPAEDRDAIDAQVIKRTELVAIAHPSLSVSDDWHDVKLAQYTTGSRFRWEIDAFLAKRALRPQIVAEADDALFLLEVAASGSYVSIVPASIARDAIASGRVRVVETLPTEQAAIYALYRSSESINLAREAAEVLAQNVPKPVKVRALSQS